jgi:hypothetical protein
MSHLAPSRLLLAVVLATACDSGNDDSKQSESDKTRNAAAAAMLGGDSVHDKARKEEEEKLKEKFAAKKAEEAKEEARVQGILDGIVKLPDDMPKGLTAACEAMMEQFHEFTIKVNHDDDGALLAWYDQKNVVLGERRAKCMKVASVEAAACQANALAGAPQDFKGMELRILSECVNKFAPEKAAEAAAAEPKMPKQ